MWDTKLTNFSTKLTQIAFSERVKIATLSSLKDSFIVKWQECWISYCSLVTKWLNNVSLSKMSSKYYFLHRYGWKRLSFFNETGSKKNYLWNFLTIKIVKITTVLFPETSILLTTNAMYSNKTTNPNFLQKKFLKAALWVIWVNNVPTNKNPKLYSIYKHLKIYITNINY